MSTDRRREDESGPDVDTTLVKRAAPRRWVLAAGAAAAILLLGLVFVLAADDDSQSTPASGPASAVPIETTPSTTEATPDLDERYLYASMPPFMAEPSAPESGELVAAVTWRTTDETWKNGAMYVYADGRVISIRAVDDKTLGSGWRERRLTPEGVEIVRSGILSSGLFDPGRETPSPLGTFDSSIVVRDGDRLLYPQFVGNVPDSFSEVVAHLRNLSTWLPETAWEHGEPMSWVPARYGVCFRQETGTIDAPLEDPAAAMSAVGTLIGTWAGDPRHWQPPDVLDTEPGPDCYDVTAASANGVALAYERAVDYHIASAGDDGYEFEAAPPVSALIHISFVPLLPHGELAIVEACTAVPWDRCASGL